MASAFTSRGILSVYLSSSSVIACLDLTRKVVAAQPTSSATVLRLLWARSNWAFSNTILNSRAFWSWVQAWLQVRRVLGTAVVELADESGGTTSCKRVASWLVIVTGKTEDFGGGGSGTGGAGVLSG